MQDIYDVYVEDMKVLGVFDFAESSSSKGARSGVVGYQRFTQLWNILFPRSRLRSWIDIPGKCDTCLEIDRLRRESKDRNIQLALKKAHHLHRGGLFMLERKR